MPTQYISPVTVLLSNGREVEAEIRVMTGTDMDIDPAVDPKPVAQLGLFNYETGEDLATADLTTETREALRTALI